MGALKNENVKRRQQRRNAKVQKERSTQIRVGMIIVIPILIIGALTLAMNWWNSWDNPRSHSLPSGAEITISNQDYNLLKQYTPDMEFTLLNPAEVISAELEYSGEIRFLVQEECFPQPPGVMGLNVTLGAFKTTTQDITLSTCPTELRVQNLGLDYEELERAYAEVSGHETTHFIWGQNRFPWNTPNYLYFVLNDRPGWFEFYEFGFLSVHLRELAPPTQLPEGGLFYVDPSTLQFDGTGATLAMAGLEEVVAHVCTEIFLNESAQMSGFVAEEASQGSAMYDVAFEMWFGPRNIDTCRQVSDNISNPIYLQQICARANGHEEPCTLVELFYLGSTLQTLPSDAGTDLATLIAETRIEIEGYREYFGIDVSLPWDLSARR